MDHLGTKTHNKTIKKKKAVDAARIIAEEADRAALVASAAAAAAYRFALEASTARSRADAADYSGDEDDEKSDSQDEDDDYVAGEVVLSPLFNYLRSMIADDNLRSVIADDNEILPSEHTLVGASSNGLPHHSTQPLPPLPMALEPMSDISMPHESIQPTQNPNMGSGQMLDPETPRQNIQSPPQNAPVNVVPTGSHPLRSPSPSRMGTIPLGAQPLIQQPIFDITNNDYAELLCDADDSGMESSISAASSGKRPRQNSPNSASAGDPLDASGGGGSLYRPRKPESSPQQKKRPSNSNTARIDLRQDAYDYHPIVNHRSRSPTALLRLLGQADQNATSIFETDVSTETLLSQPQILPHHRDIIGNVFFQGTRLSILRETTRQHRSCDVGCDLGSDKKEKFNTWSDFSAQGFHDSNTALIEHFHLSVSQMDLHAAESAWRRIRISKLPG
jgi:hypothetical protein